MRKDIKYKSLDNITDIHAVIWVPEVPIKAILQISHGMKDHIIRYNEFAEYLNKYGILVCGNDHLGHGDSVIDKDHYGYFAKNDADEIVVDDVYTLTKMMKEEYKGVPYFTLGHSMGSFIIRNFIAKYGKDTNGCIIMGTAHHSTILMKFAKVMTTIIQFYHRGWFYRSRFLDNQTTGKFYKKFDNNENKYCWLTKDENVLKSYVSDPKTHFRFTCNGFYTMFSFIENANKSIKQIDKDLPILFLSGKNDPVSNFGKDIYKLYKRYKKLGIKDVKMKLYNNVRHEVLNESEKVIAYNDVVQFINQKRLKPNKRES